MAEISLPEKLSATPRLRAKIYRLKRPAVSERSVRALARTLGFKNPRAGKVSSGSETLTYAEGPLQLTIYRASGGMRYRDLSRWQVDDRRAEFDLSDRSAQRAAQRFAGRNLRVKGAETRFLKAARLRVGEVNRETKESFERTVDVAVAMQRLVDKVPVDGPGGKIVIYLDRDGAVTGFERIWREIGRAYRSGGALRSPQAAIDEMASQWKDRVGIVEVNQVRFGYFEEGWRKSQNYLQPAYVIIGTIYSHDRRVRRKTVYVATALEKPIGRLTPALRNKPRQPKRAAAPSTGAVG